MSSHFPDRGENHTIVVDGPLFKKRIRIQKAEPVLKEGFWRHRNLHCTREYANLASILPDLYRDYGSEIR